MSRDDGPPVTVKNQIGPAIAKMSNCAVSGRNVAGPRAYIATMTVRSGDRCFPNVAMTLASDVMNDVL